MTNELMLKKMAFCWSQGPDCSDGRPLYVAEMSTLGGNGLLGGINSALSGGIFVYDRAGNPIEIRFADNFKAIFNDEHEIEKWVSNQPKSKAVYMILND
jgi:hypothetical protein